MAQQVVGQRQPGVEAVDAQLRPEAEQREDPAEDDPRPRASGVVAARPPRQDAEDDGDDRDRDGGLEARPVPVAGRVEAGIVDAQA